MSILYEDAVSNAVQSVSEDMEALIEKYDEAYASARNSLDGTFGLFEKVEEKAGVSSQAIIDAWQTQIDFFKEYDENLQSLMNMDLDPKFLEKLSDGSQESAGQVKALMDDNAAKAAKDTIDAYIQEIESGISRAQTAAASVAKAAASQLASRGISTVGIPGYATGTTNAPDMFIAGENGPELIVGAGGSTVFPAEETSDILTAARHVSVGTAPPDGFEFGDSTSCRPQDEKKITLDINGSGGIDVTGADEETVWEIVAPRLKSAFMGIIRADIFEEGDRAYIF